MEDNLILNADELEAVSQIIQQYTDRQKEVINEYLTRIESLSSSWKDDETFAPLFNEISFLKVKVEAKMDRINAAYVPYFKSKAELIRSRPTFGSSGYGSSYSSNASEPLHSSIFVPFSPHKIDIVQLNSSMCSSENVRRSDYVRASQKGNDLDQLEDTDRLLSPVNGKHIYCKRVAWRSLKSVDDFDPIKVCGADFYYADGTFCGSYTGTSWEDIVAKNENDTKKYRDKGERKDV